LQSFRSALGFRVLKNTSHLANQEINPRLRYSHRKQRTSLINSAQLLNYRIAKLPNYQITKLPNYQIAKLPNCQIAKLPNCQIVELKKSLPLFLAAVNLVPDIDGFYIVFLVKNILEKLVQIIKAHSFKFIFSRCFTAYGY